MYKILFTNILYIINKIRLYFLYYKNHITSSKNSYPMKREILYVLALYCVSTTLPAQVAVRNERSINSSFQEYSPTFYGTDLVFVATNPVITRAKTEEKNTYSTAIFLSKQGKDGFLERPTAFAEDLTTKFYDAPLSFNQAGDEVFFTRFNLKNGQLKRGQDGKTSLKIYTAKLSNKGKWTNISELPFCSNDYDCAYPSVSADGQTLYFASNKPGGQGGMDIYVSVLKDNKWQDPSNVGALINTPLNEVFPFIHADGTLFFSSNGHKGLGGLDIFSTKKTKENWLTPNPLPEAINSEDNDFGIVISADNTKGYFTSNRKTGQGDDDIFSFNIKNNWDKITLAYANMTENIPEKVAFDTAKGFASLSSKTMVEPQKQSDNEPLKSEKVLVSNVVEAVKPKVDISIFSIDKTSDSSLAYVELNVINMKSLKNAVILTDTMGILTGLRADNGEEIAINSLPTLSEMTNEKGNITLRLTAGDRYLFNFSKAGFQAKFIIKTILPNDKRIGALLMPDNAKYKNTNTPVKKRYTYKKDTLPTTMNVKLRTDNFDESKPSSTKPVSMASDIAKQVSQGFTYELHNIYYAYNDADINEAAKTELEPLVALLKEQPMMEIEVMSHTDSRGNAQYNLSLSQLRSDNIKSYLIEKGVNWEKIRSIGAGEGLLKNKCSDGITCSEDEHKVNRRTEIRTINTPQNGNIKTQQKVELKENTVINHEKFGDEPTINITNINTLKSAKVAYLVIVGTFTRPENAEKQRKKVIDAGFVEAELIQYQDTYLYGVSVRQFKEEADAKILVKEINQQKEFEAFVKEIK